MDIRFSGKNLKVTKGVKEHMNDRIGKLEKYSPKIVESHVVISKEKHNYTAHITLLGKNFRAFGEGDHKDNLYAAIDQAVDRVQKQLKKHREKVKDHYKQHGENVVPMKEKVANRIMKRGLEDADRPVVVRMPSYVLKPMSVDEASMQLEMKNQEFIVFSNAETSLPNVIFKLADGNHGLIEPTV